MSAPVAPMPRAVQQQQHRPRDTARQGGNGRFKKGNWRKLRRERQAENRRKAAVAREEEKKCRVCHEAEAKYKCPTCRVRFCSVTCSKKHKLTPCSPPPPAPEPKPKPQRESRANNNERKEEEEKVVLTEEQKTALDKSEVVQSKMTSSRLREDLASILGAANPSEALSNAMKNAEFLAFCDDVLGTIDGSFIQ